MAHLWVTLLGRPGAGKTTVGIAFATRRVADLGEVSYISGSRLLDEYIAAEREGWEGLKKNKDMGRTADADFTHRLLRERIDLLGEDGVVLLDGFPKSLSELPLTEDTVGGAIDLAVLLDCPAAECVERIEHRLVCGKCGGVVREGVVSASSKCERDGCDGLLQRRADDDCEARIFTQGDESAVVIPAHFRRLGRLLELDALQPTETLIAEMAAGVRSQLAEASPQNGS